jgi:cobalamin biosynthesis protein CobT
MSLICHPKDKSKTLIEFDKQTHSDLFSKFNNELKGYGAAWSDAYNAWVIGTDVLENEKVLDILDKIKSECGDEDDDEDAGDDEGGDESGDSESETDDKDGTDGGDADDEASGEDESDSETPDTKASKLEKIRKLVIKNPAFKEYIRSKLTKQEAKQLFSNLSK